MLVAVAPGSSGSGLLRELGQDGLQPGPVLEAADLAAAVAGRERAAGDVRWVWPDTASVYPQLLAAGTRVRRCHDVALCEAVLLGRDGRLGETATLSAAWARQARRPVPVPAPDLAAPAWAAQPALFEPEAGGVPGPGAAEVLDELTAVYAAQRARIGASDGARQLAMLVSAESAGGLAAAEMTAAGLPWRAEVHDRLLTGMLGGRPPGSALRPPRLAELAAGISAALGGRPVNPDSPAQLTRALAAHGVQVRSTRLADLRRVDHPVIPQLLEYKELSRLHAAFGWAWLDSWVSGGRFRPQYVVGGVVSGRWASRGGGALQIPRLLRQAVVADPGWVLVVADAAQLEPRVLAALAGDRAFAAAAAEGDLYAALAGSFGGERAKAKVALLSAMYGGAGGEAGQLLAVLRRRFPRASQYVEAAARAGEEGKVVCSVLGRACPPPSAGWRAVTGGSADPQDGPDPAAGRASRARGRFTRNFVVQASAADWALVLLAGLRARLAGIGGNDGGGPGDARPELVFFQHDEVIVHCPRAAADDVVAAAHEAAQAAGRLVFGATPVRFPLSVHVVERYYDAK